MGASSRSSATITLVRQKTASRSRRTARTTGSTTVRSRPTRCVRCSAARASSRLATKPGSRRSCSHQQFRFPAKRSSPPGRSPRPKTKGTTLWPLDLDFCLRTPGNVEDLVVVGRIRSSHGVKGVVVIEPMTASPEEVFTPGRELIAGSVQGEASVPERRLRIDMAEPFKEGFRVQFAGINDRDEADRWRNRYVLSPRAELPEPEEGEIYLHDLVGLTVVGQDGQVIGEVQAYYELRHDVMLEVDRPAGSVMIPYQFVSEVDLEAKRIVVE